MTRPNTLTAYEQRILDTAIFDSINLHTVHALDKARAVGLHGDLMHELDNLERVPRDQFHEPALLAPSAARPVGIAAIYSKTSELGMPPIDLELKGERVCRIWPGQMAYFYLPVPEHTVYVLADGTRRRVSTADAILPD